MLGAFECLLKAMGPKDDEADWEDRMTHLLYSYGFTNQQYRERSPKKSSTREEVDWVVDALHSGASRSGVSNNKGISDRGLKGDFSPIKSIIKIENSMISGNECRMVPTSNSKEEDNKIDKRESHFHPWIGGRWTKLAIVILSILRENRSVRQQLEAHEEWLTIPKNLSPSDYVRVLPVKTKKAEPSQENSIITVSLNRSAHDYWKPEMHVFTLELDSSSTENRVLDRMMRNADPDSPLWISISKPLPMWNDKENKYHIPKYHWNLINNEDNFYHLQPREEG